MFFRSFTLLTYVVKCKCSLSDEPVRTICIGPSIPPCDCSQPSCEVNNLYTHALYKFMLVTSISVIHLLLAIMDFVGWILMVMAVLMKI